MVQWNLRGSGRGATAGDAAAAAASDAAELGAAPDPLSGPNTLASLRQSSGPLKGDPFCSAVLIKANVLLTSASCVAGADLGRPPLPADAFLFPDVSKPPSPALT